MKTYYININFKFNEKTLTAMPTNINGGYCDGTRKDTFALTSRTNKILFNCLTKAIVLENYYGIRQLLKDDLGINIDDCDIELNNNMYCVR